LDEWPNRKAKQPRWQAGFLLYSRILPAIFSCLSLSFAVYPSKGFYTSGRPLGLPVSLAVVPIRGRTAHT
jgi:hypothetical protein